MTEQTRREDPGADEPEGTRHDVPPLAIITAGSTGVGYDLAVQFAERGYDLLIIGRGPELEDAALRLAELGVEVQTSQVDLSTYQAVEQLYTSIRALGRPVEAMAVNTGGAPAGGDRIVPRDGIEDELRAIRLDVVAAVHLTRRVTTDMVERGRGRVIFTASGPPRTGRHRAGYAASAAFISVFAQTLRLELAGTGVDVTHLSEWGAGQ